MAHKIGILGAYNTGKSFSRSFLTKPEEVVVLASSSKNTYLKDKNGSPLPRLPEFAEMGKLVSAGNPIPGNWELMKSIPDVEKYLTVISNKMPHIKTVIIPDFAHFISKLIASDSFKQRSVGGQAFARFWDLAADSLNAFFLKADSLREDLIIVTEFHSEWDEAEQTFRIKVPSGKMLADKFMPESYFDIMLCTHVGKNDDDSIDADCYKFVTRKHGVYNARSMELFNDTFIPNNLQLVLDAVRGYYHI